MMSTRMAHAASSRSAQTVVNSIIMHRIEPVRSSSRVRFLYFLIRGTQTGIGLPSVERGANFLQNERGYEYICRPRQARSHLEDLKDLGKNFSATIASVSQTIVYKMKRLIIRDGITNEWIPNEEIDNSENPIKSQKVYGRMWNRKGTERKGSPKAY